MKKLISMALALVLALALAVPSYAAEDLEPPLWQEYGFSSREECIQLMFAGDESVYQEAVDEQLERQAWEASKADEIAAFDPDAYWASDECWYSSWYDSKEEFMEDWLLDSQEQFRDVMLEDWLSSQWDAYRQSTLVSRTLEKMGGTPGQVGVMLDGKYISFGGSTPEVVSGVTMVSCRPVLEAFGGTVSRQGDEVVCVMDGTTYRLRSGSGVISVTDGAGASSEIELGAACYEKNGATYMPLRPFAEALGCDVLWDSSFQTAVLLRREAVTAQLDGEFTVFNRMLSALTLDPQQNYRTAAEFDAKIKLLDSISGDKTYAMDAQMELLQSGSVLNLSASMDLSALLELEDLTYGLSAAEKMALRSALRDVQAELIYDGEAGMMYWKLSLMDLLSDGSLPSDSWIATPAATLENVSSRGPVTMGSLLYESLLSQAQWGSSYYYDGMVTPATMYGNLMDGAGELAGYIGDGCFQESGSYDILHYGEEEYTAALEEIYGPGSAEYMSDFDQLEMELKVARSGSATFRLLMQTRDDGSYSYNPAVLVDLSGELTPSKVDMGLLVKVKNQMELTLSYTATVAATSDTPRTQPPAGEDVVNAYEEEPGAEAPGLADSAA